MVMRRAHIRNSRRDEQVRARRAFTLLDLIVSIAVITLLVSLLLPSLSFVAESGRRVVCQSNLRQVGIGLLGYAEDNKGLLAPSVYLQNGPGRSSFEPQSMIALRVPPERQTFDTTWDGLGLLYKAEIVDEPKVFYCPSHQGGYRFNDQADAWRAPEGEIVGNFQYRGQGPATNRRANGVTPMTRFLAEIDPAQSSLISDGLRSRIEFNHTQGANFFRADMTIRWFNDRGQRLFSRLSHDKDEAQASVIQDAWDRMDRASQSTTVEQDE